MIKIKFGSIQNVKTGETMDIVVNALSKNNVSDILIGYGIVLVGITYLSLTAFRNGAKAFDTAEYKTLKALRLLEE